MKKIRCPKCDQFIDFDETNYLAGQSLVFICEHCGKQFSIRIIKKPKKESLTESEDETKEKIGYITILENTFNSQQKFNLVKGDNTFGRRCKGTIINQPIETNDYSIDRIHCIIHVSQNSKGKYVYILRDAPSVTGTFYMNKLLGDKDRILIKDGAIITIGAATLILHLGEE